MTEDEGTPHISEFKETAYRALLPGLVYSLKCIVQELNKLRERLGYGPVTVDGLEEGWTKPKKSGITEEGRKKLAQMMRERWEEAKKEGKHVSEFKPPKKANNRRVKKIDKPYPEV